MLTEEEIQKNKDEIINHLRSLKIEGADVEGLISFMEKGEFFEAPASTIYHSAYVGGLAQHTLNVLNICLKLNDEFNLGYSKDSIIICCIGHDLSKTNFYEISTKSKKMYNENGKKSDNYGKFDWFTEQSFKVKDVHDRFIGADHGTNSYLLLSRYIPLTEEEIVAIMNHHCGMDNGFVNKDLSAILNAYPLATILHSADFMATYLLERV